MQQQTSDEKGSKFAQIGERYVTGTCKNLIKIIWYYPPTSDHYVLRLWMGLPAVAYARSAAFRKISLMGSYWSIDNLLHECDLFCFGCRESIASECLFAKTTMSICLQIPTWRHQCSDFNNKPKRGSKNSEAANPIWRRNLLHRRVGARKGSPQK